jgi:hypothetical protein
LRIGDEEEREGGEKKKKENVVRRKIKRVRIWEVREVITL